MRVLMLGWEFPPFFAGGVGIVCRALTEALAARGVDVCYLMPEGPDPSVAPHMRLLQAKPSGTAATRAATTATGEVRQRQARHGWAGGIRFERLAAALTPYSGIEAYRLGAEQRLDRGSGGPATADLLGLPNALPALRTGAAVAPVNEISGGERGAELRTVYGSKLFEDIVEFAFRAVATLDSIPEVDVIHAHDWTTFPAALALREATGKPVVVHVHITEFDKTGGSHADGFVYSVERAGMEGADRVLTVSRRVRDQVVERYGIDAAKVSVVHNAVEAGGRIAGSGLRGDRPIVLFLGRVTLQKGPEYFLRAARRVLALMPGVTFVLAGSGDMLPRMIELAAELGIGEKVLFPGFVDRAEVEALYGSADVFVMPSVSEPFGIVPLEAIQRGVPVILSQQSGVSEVIENALKVDFWDVERMAELIIAALSYGTMGEALRDGAAREIGSMTWSRVAQTVEQIYHEVAPPSADQKVA